MDLTIKDTVYRIITLLILAFLCLALLFNRFSYLSHFDEVDKQIEIILENQKKILGEKDAEHTTGRI